MMKRMFLGTTIALLFLMPTMMRAQATQVVRGHVCDVASGEPMIGVTIQVENGITLGAVTDMDGYFEIGRAHV